MGAFAYEQARVDNFAADGTRLLNLNFEAQCMPTRSALMTGRFSIRSGTCKVPLGGIPDGLTLWNSHFSRLTEVLSDIGENAEDVQVVSLECKTSGPRSPSLVT